MMANATPKHVGEIKYAAIISQQDATIYNLFICVNCSTCFGWYLHPSSGAHITVSTLSGIIDTVTAICRERDVVDSSNGVDNAGYCRYSDMRS